MRARVGYRETRQARTGWVRITRSGVRKTARMPTAGTMLRTVARLCIDKPPEPPR